MALFHSLSDIIGNTPVLELHRSQRAWGLKASIYAKLEYFNPLGSVKDRAALYMIQDAENRGILKEDTIVIEPTSGNTGIGLAFICASKGIRLILTMPENMSVERQRLLSALGAEIVLTPAWEGMDGAVKKALLLHQENPNSYIPDQFGNPANVRAHVETTAQELLRDLGPVDILVASFGTGGTITGIGQVLKQVNPECKIIAVEPAYSPLLSAGRFGAHKIQGIGANFIPKILDTELLDEVLTITDEDAYATSREVAKLEGLLVGISSGAALLAARIVASRTENAEKRIAVILPDTGERYLSVGLYDPL